MSLVFYSTEPLRDKWRQARKFLRKCVGAVSRPRPHTLLLYVISFYIVCSRLGPLATRVGESAFETFELGHRLEAEFDREGLETIRGAYRRFRDSVRVPGPFARRSSLNSLLVIMGNSGSSRKNKQKEREGKPEPADNQKVQATEIEQTAKDDSVVVEEAGVVVEEAGVVVKEAGVVVEEAGVVVEEAGTIGSDMQSKPDTEQASKGSKDDSVATSGDKIQAQAEKVENESEKVENESEKVENELEKVENESEKVENESEKVESESEKVENKSEKAENESEGDSEASDETAEGGTVEPDWGFRKRRIKQHRFSEIEHTISTGDLALLYREGQEVPHYAVFVQHSECDPNFPLLLIKGKTKPLPMNKFTPVRHAHPVSAVTRIFYGDYKQVAIRRLNLDKPIECEKTMALIDEVTKIPFTPHELDAIAKANSPEERSSIVCTLMVSHLYHLLGMLQGDPSSVTPANLEDHLDLHNPVFLKLPPVKFGPVTNDDPPFLAKLVDGIYPPPDVTTKTYSSVTESLDTGDIVLFSGATSSGAIIKFFDRSQFSHIGLVLKAKYTSQLLIWEASTNKAGLVDIESGKVRRGVELLPLRHKIFSGWYNRVAVRKLAGIPPEKRVELYEELLKFRKEIQGRPYEKDKVELILSAIDIQEGFLSFLRNQHEDLSSLFCSELVAAAYQRMGLLGKEKLSNEYTPDDFCSARNLKLNIGYLEPEVYIELKFDLEYGEFDKFGRQISAY